MSIQKLQFIEVPPFDAYVIAGKSPSTFGLKEFFAKPTYEVEIIVSEERKAQQLEQIIHQESRRKTTDVLLQGIAGASAGTGFLATAGVVGSGVAGTCTAVCSPLLSPLLYTAFTPLAGIAAALAIIPAGYAVVKRLGQKKVMQRLEKSLTNAKIKVINYEPLLHSLSISGLPYRISRVNDFRSLPRKMRKYVKYTLPREEGKVHVDLCVLSGLSSRLQQDTGEEAYHVLAQTYGFLAGNYGEQLEKKSLVMLKQVRYAPVSRKSLLVAGVGIALFLTGAALWAMGTDPLEYFSPSVEDTFK